jgi:hypothetical protein
MSNLRQIMTNEIKASGWMDSWYKRGDMNAENFSSYEEWLNSLSDSDFLFSYNRVRDFENELD